MERFTAPVMMPSSVAESKAKQTSCSTTMAPTWFLIRSLLQISSYFTILFQSKTALYFIEINITKMCHVYIALKTDDMYPDLLRPPWPQGGSKPTGGKLNRTTWLKTRLTHFKKKPFSIHQTLKTAMPGKRTLDGFSAICFLPNV